MVKQNKINTISNKFRPPLDDFYEYEHENEYEILEYKTLKLMKKKGYNFYAVGTTKQKRKHCYRGHQGRYHLRW